MYEINTDNRFHRVYAITTDKYGVDPLLDKLVPKLQQINRYKTHEVKQDERGSPDLISIREYGTEDFWWHIMSYNGVCHYRDIVEGQTLKIPDLGDIVSITNDTSIEVARSGENIITI